jgi:hypothetical protein
MPEFNVAIHADTLRSLAFGSISGTYANVGTITTHPFRVIFITNTTDADVIFSLNGGITDNFVIPTKQSLSLDGASNCFSNNGYIPQGTQFAVKQVSAPSLGSVYVAGVYT